MKKMVGPTLPLGFKVVKKSISVLYKKSHYVAFSELHDSCILIKIWALTR
jgi:hypothetical protein